jgi:peptide/nickel transport system permease protein
MTRYVFRRLVQAVFTVFGVMLLTFVLFRIIAGDVSTAYVNQKLGIEARQAFYEKHKLDRPSIFNFHKRLQFIDNTTGSHVFTIKDIGGSMAARALNLHLAPPRHSANPVGREPLIMASRLVFALSASTPLSAMTDNKPLFASAPKTDGVASKGEGSPSLRFTLSDGTQFEGFVKPKETCGKFITAIQACPNNRGKLTVAFSSWSLVNVFDAQFFWHLWENVTFQGRSYATNQTLLEIIGQRAKFSLSITVPALVLTWLISMIISCFVAYYRGTWIDKFGVLLTVLGMCIPYLAYMLLGQWVMFKIAPEYAAGLFHPSSIYVPVLIAVVAGLGSEVRFYRTIILNEINKDYVRTARAKGVPLTSILFLHVLKNCMLPILTDLISTIPFLIMGALLLERFFGIPGLGDLLLTSITSRDVPIITGLTYLTAVLYVISLIITDILYAVFDPRIRLQ